MLTSNTQESFDAIVAKDVRNKANQEERFYLRDPENLDAWHDSLVALSKSIDFQFASNKIQKSEKTSEYKNNVVALKEYLESYNDWKLKTLRFKHEVEARIAECKRLRKKYFTDMPVLSSNLYNKIQNFVEAIDNHRNTILNDKNSNDDSYEELSSIADEKLWSLLDDKSIEQIKQIFTQENSTA